MPVYPNESCFILSDMNRSVTALVVYEASGGGWTVKGRVKSGGGNHAEEELAADMNGANRLNISQGASIYIEITKSPCHYHEENKCCSNVLVRLKSSGRVSSIKIKYMGIYESNSHGGTWHSVAGIMELEGDGIDTDPWDPSTSVNAHQLAFLAHYQQLFDSGSLGSGYWTNLRTRHNHTQQQPGNNFWGAPMNK